MGEWISVKDRLPETPHKESSWDEDAQQRRRYANSRVHPVIWWGRKKRWVLDYAVYTSGWCEGWSQADSLTTVKPEFWLDIPAFPSRQPLPPVPREGK